MELTERPPIAGTIFSLAFLPIPAVKVPTTDHINHEYESYEGELTLTKRDSRNWGVSQARQLQPSIRIT
jgi:hypothetical protein